MTTKIRNKKESSSATNFVLNIMKKKLYMCWYDKKMNMLAKIKLCSLYSYHWMVLFLTDWEFT